MENISCAEVLSLYIFEKVRVTNIMYHCKIFLNSYTLFFYIEFTAQNDAKIFC